MSVFKIASRNRTFLSLSIEAKLIENLVNSLWDSKMTNFTSINDMNMHSY